MVGGDRAAAGAERIYAAATDLIMRGGFDALDIDVLAARVHCSRATVYRHAGGKAQIRDVVVTRIAAGIIDTVRQAVQGLNGRQRVVTAIGVALEAIRSAPMRRLMLSSTNPSELGDLHASPALRQLAGELSGVAADDPQSAQWVVRVVLSLAYWPVGDSETEWQLLQRFVAPAFG